MLALDIKSEFGKLDILVNNASAYFDQGGSALKTEMQFVKDALDINL